MIDRFALKLSATKRKKRETQTVPLLLGDNALNNQLQVARDDKMLTQQSRQSLN